MMLYKSQHLQRIIRKNTYSGNTEILVVLFISEKIIFTVICEMRHWARSLQYTQMVRTIHRAAASQLPSTFPQQC